jgi:23S rRNA pseudouridine1911/1915/1917 synthase
LSTIRGNAVGRRATPGSRGPDQVLDRPAGHLQAAPFSAPKLPEIDVIFEDSALIVVSKPAGMLTVPLRTAVTFRLSLITCSSIMRLQGSVSCSRSTALTAIPQAWWPSRNRPEAQLHLKAQFERQEPVRTYWAVVYGRPVPPREPGELSLLGPSELRQRESRKGSVNAKEAISHYRLLESFRTTSLLEVNLQTGKRNQIRVQAGLRGYPLVGEKKYLCKRPGAFRLIARPCMPGAWICCIRIDDRQMSFEALHLRTL